jgi:hypothetical protein
MSARGAVHSYWEMFFIGNDDVASMLSSDPRFSGVTIFDPFMVRQTGWLSLTPTTGNEMRKMKQQKARREKALDEKSLLTFN